MSDDNNSLLTNLKNKIKYKAHKAVYDPNANQFAQDKANQANQANQATAQADNKNVESTDSNDTSDPNKFNTKRIVKNIGNQTLYILKSIFIPFISLMLAMIVVNEMIVYTAPIRLIFFIFILIICIFMPFYAIVLSVFYILKGGYSYFINHMTNGPKQHIMPTIFALLPLTTYKPISSFAAFFLYPFTYPKTEIAKTHLPVIMKDYYDRLVESFKGFETIKNIPIFAEDIKKIHSNFEQLHAILNNPSSNPSSNTSSSKPSSQLSNTSSSPPSNTSKNEPSNPSSNPSSNTSKNEPSNPSSNPSSNPLINPLSNSSNNEPSN